ncbi:MAG TPA: bifunctional folylpolyglutamate synthase/dihydrofolate synthase [Firmicutes bacterium]|nr:bifunctional folylpolyglutamate synthase/dihydrofolate synthase [Bacillota bacterium]
MTNLSYKKILDNIYARHQKTIKYNLDNIKLLDKILNYPSRSFKSIHITGTNGKGSVAAIIHSIYSSTSLSTGLLTSPHLINFTERIRLNNREIKQEEVISLYLAIENAIKLKWKKKELPSFFEYVTAMAFLYFKRQKVDVAVIEVGLGGRLDATNIINPVASVVTNVDYDHTKTLGGSLRKIAFEKAGIIKKGVPVIIGEKREMLKNIFRRKAEEMKAPFIEARPENFNLFIISDDLFKQVISFNFDRNQVRVNFPLTGLHQLDNLAIALETVRYLSNKNIFRITAHSLKKGLPKTWWPGRNEFIFHDKNYMLIDGAHNRMGFVALNQYLKTIFPNFSKKYLLIGILKDKLYKKELIELARMFDRVYVTAPVSDRALKPDILKNLFSPYVKTEIITRNDILNYKRNLGINLNDKDILVCTGSLYLIGYFKERIKQKNLYVEV